MDRLACIDVAELPLQLVLQRYPEWAESPVAVVDEDRPQGVILWVNAQAREFGVLPGQRYAQALSLARMLRASVVPPEAIGVAVGHLIKRLRDYTPCVEPSVDEPGVFWLDASGLERLYPDLGAWAEAVVAGLAEDGLSATVVVGFDRFATYAIARASGPGARLLQTVSHERDVALDVPLSRIGISPGVRDRLARLSITTVGDLVALPEAGLKKRYGNETTVLWRTASGALSAPLAPLQPREPLVASVSFDQPVRSHHRLLFRLKELLDTLLKRVGERHALVSGLRLGLLLDCGAKPEERVEERLRPAAPTRDRELLLELIRLRFESLALRHGASDMHLLVEDVQATAAQLQLLSLGPRRDQQAASRALARISAELGDDVVGRLQVEQGHLPEAQAAFVPFAGELPRPAAGELQPVLVRRVYRRSQPLPQRPRCIRNDGWQPRDREQGPIMNIHGPYIVSGGWWQREVHREYAFAETQRGDLLWVYYDRRRRRWFEQGRVE